MHAIFLLLSLPPRSKTGREIPGTGARGALICAGRRFAALVTRVLVGLWLLTAGCAAIPAAGVAGVAEGAAAGDPGAGDPYIVVLGVAQDAGAPQAGCDGPCCAAAWDDRSARHQVSCLAIVDPARGQRWMIDATPDFRDQLRALDSLARPTGHPGLDGILLTHAHIGHYTGLMFVGHESMGARDVPVYAMPRMRSFLETNGPWDQLVRYGNVELRSLEENTPVALNDRISVTPIRVPHREEYSEVVGFVVRGPRRSALFVPDIDKWDRWDRRIEDVLATVDLAWLDGTFFADGELPNRDMSAIPHPFIRETMDRLQSLPATDRASVRFIHLNHTNPALRDDAPATREIRARGFEVARELDREGI